MTAPASIQIYRVYIKATAETVWGAITRPEWTTKYGYGGLADFDLRPGGTYQHRADDAMLAEGAKMGREVPQVIVDGEVVESDPPRKLVQTWRMLMDPGTAQEAFTRLTWEIEPSQSGVVKLTVIHELDNAPKTAAMVSGSFEAQGGGGGWSWILSDLKTLLETGQSFQG